MMIAAPTAHAQSAEAEALFVDGAKLMTDGKIAAACDAFEASNQIEARAGTLIRLGECREQNHQVASAWSAYKDALTRVKDPRKRAIATAKVAELEPKLSYLTVSVPAVSRLDGLTLTRNDKPFDATLWNRALPVDGGDYLFVGRAPGHDDWKATVRAPIDSGKITLDVPKLEPTNKVVDVVTAPPPPEVQEDPPAPATTFTTKRKVAIGVAGVGVLGLAGGIVFSIQAKGKQSDAHASCVDPQMPCANADAANALIKSAQSRALAANISFGVGAALAIAAGVLWFTGAPETPAQQVTVVPTFAPGETGVAILGRF
ncbi:MAG: hypothetical protein ABI591_08185 [Kofleriaceae bacterium]